jgi:hypothetical protein
MRQRLIFALGLALGFAGGLHIGRTRQDEVNALVRRVRESTNVQEAAGIVAAGATGAAHRARNAAAHVSPLSRSGQS